jgi:hypothetical protein
MNERNNVDEDKKKKCIKGLKYDSDIKENKKVNKSEWNDGVGSKKNGKRNVDKKEDLLNVLEE